MAQAKRTRTRKAAGSKPTREGAELQESATALAEIPDQRVTHGDLDLEPVTDDDGEPEGGKRARVRDAVPLDAYLQREKLDERQWQAGKYLEKAYRKAVTGANVTMSYEERIPSGQTPKAPVKDSYSDFTQVLVKAGLATSARDSLGDPLVRGYTLTPPCRIAIKVCGDGDWAGGTRNLLRLSQALTDLADYLRVESRHA